MTQFENLAIISVYLPLLGFLLSMIFIKIRSISVFCSIVCITVSIFSSVLLISKSGGSLTLNISLFEWIRVQNLHLIWGLRIDPLSLIMLSLVNLISFLVHIYSLGYMKNDPSKARFMGFLSFFTFMMLILVTSSNLAQFFVGWEGVGLASYLLIGFWWERPSAAKAATKAFVVNRIGDAGIILAMGLIFVTFNSLDFDVIQTNSIIKNLSNYKFLGLSLSTFDLIGLFLIIGAIGKSAQFGLHVWLPDAMEGPTPVSALIHSATMVTAGVFLVLRFYYIFELSPFCKAVLLGIGIFTAFFAATVAINQNDIKRIVAYSTCSQLGYMVAACGAGAYNAAFFHLVTHAFFKALLFLGAGAVIHAMSDEQDITKMGGIYKQIPITYGLMWIGTLALIGMPFFAGYYSKDAILNAFHLGGNPISYGIGILVVSFTSYYAIRLMILVFHGKPRANDYVMAHIHKLPLTMGMPMIILAIGAIVGGYFGQKLFLHNSKFDWKQSLIIKTSKMQESFIYENIPIIFVAIGVLIFILFVKNIYRNIKKEKMNKILFFLKNKWWIDELYEKIICKPTLIIGKFFAKSVDHLILDRFGPEGFSKLSFLISNQNKPLQTGYVYHYAFIMVIGILILSAILMFMNFYGR